MPPHIVLQGSACIGERVLFRALSLPLEAGAWTCLLGPSGVGKTTLLRILAALDTGVDFDGRVVVEDGLPLSGRVAIMAQSDNLMPWLSVLENIVIGARLRGERADRERAGALIARVGLAGHEGKKIYALSGGERQRVALVRTLMEERPVVLLDEPFCALDACLRAEMQELAAELLQGKTVFLITHDPNEAARLGTYIYVLNGGQLSPVESPAMLSTHPCRPCDAPEVFACQNRLLSLLRGG